MENKSKKGLLKYWNLAYKILGGRKMKHKESQTARKERIELSGSTCTRIVKDKTKYTRKIKHKVQ